jgi:Resolvase, N terminal domain
MLIGYARVSTQEQDTALQRDALKAVGCEKVFTEKASACNATGLSYRQRSPICAPAIRWWCGNSTGWRALCAN